MGNPLSLQRWSPYVVGAGIGLLSWLSFATADKPIGINMAFEYTTALAESAAAPHLAQSYLSEQTKKGREPKIDWEWMLVLGVFLGAYVSSKMSDDRMCRKGFRRSGNSASGDKRLLRYAGALAGGFIMMLGARIAQGCTSGHAISEALQLALGNRVSHLWEGGSCSCLTILSGSFLAL